ncbi:hypothetical protein [Rossellomorea sp. NS-SX7]|uniref:hypothetical protein n=1 Tax=Rossellomorea sp. NS-SX7 TaxID=3463856 RepID=UPI00405A0797
MKSIIKPALWLVLIGSTLTFLFHFSFGVILIGMKGWDSFGDFLQFVLFEHHGRAWWQISFLLSILSAASLVRIRKQEEK